MRIGLVARWLDLHSGGAKEYTRQLIHHLLKVDPQNEYFIYYKSNKFLRSFPDPNAHESVIPFSNRFLWDYIGLPLFAAHNKLDLVWSPSYIIPFTLHRRSAVTFHDLAYFFFSEAYQWADITYMQAAIPGSIKRATAILSVSESTKADIIHLSPEAKPKTFVTYEAASPLFRRISDEVTLSSVRKTYHLDQPFIFFAGSISPRKGLPLLVKAFIALKKKYKVNHKLVITGGRQWGAKNQEIFNGISPSDVQILGHVPDDVLPVLYSLSDLFVFPSLYEGFGLPLLEAMACGCPVVCSDRTSLPEVAGDAALLVNPENTAELADAMAEIIKNKAKRMELISRGYERASAFSWENTAINTLKVFEWAVR